MKQSAAGSPGGNSTPIRVTEQFDLNPREAFRFPEEKYFESINTSKNIFDKHRPRGPVLFLHRVVRILFMGISVPYSEQDVQDRQGTKQIVATAQLNLH